MPFGDLIGNVVGAISGPESRGAAIGSAIGGGLDLAMSGIGMLNAGADARAERERLAQLTEAQLQMTQQRYADERAIRDRVLNRAAQLDGALKAAAERMGSRVGVSPDDVFRNYQTFRTQLMDDYNDVLDRVSSQGFADAAARGMDRSTQMDAARADLAARAADYLPKLDQSAWDAAINRSRGYADTLNYGRGATLDEIGAIYGGAADLERGLVTSQAPGMMQNSIANQGTLAGNAAQRAADAQSGFGTTLANFNQTVAPNLGYALTGEGGYTQPRDDRITELEEEVSTLRRALGG